MGDNGPILVTGATAQQGGAVARALIAKDQKVRVLTRHPEKAAALAKAGAEIVQGDLTDEAILQLALRGVSGVFAMSTPFEAGMDAEVRQGMMMADVAKQAGIRSQLSANPRLFRGTMPSTAKNSAGRSSAATPMRAPAVSASTRRSTFPPKPEGSASRTRKSVSTRPRTTRSRARSSSMMGRSSKTD